MVNKQNMFKLIALMVIAAMMVSCSVIQQAIEKPTVQVQEVSYQPVNIRQGRLDSKIRITNPNGFPLPLRNMICHLKINGHEIADLRLNFDKDLPAKKSMLISAPISFQYGDLVSGLGSLFQQRAVKFQLEGTIDLRVITVPFSKTGDFKIKIN